MAADSPSRFTPYFGGPDLPRGCLRDVLAQRVAAVPSGGEIDWVTYYFRDRRLAQALIDARRRGVRVRVTLDATPRTGHANERVLAMLSGPDGLGPDLRTVQHRPFPGSRRKPRLHEKLYCFSHPAPEALVGSFNPSGDDPEEQPDIIDEILDQDRGHNFLVAINDPQLVNGLLRHARHIHQGRHGLLERFDPAMNRRLSSGDTTIHFWPRISPQPLFAPAAWCWQRGPGAGGGLTHQGTGRCTRSCRPDASWRTCGGAGGEYPPARATRNRVDAAATPG